MLFILYTIAFEIQICAKAKYRLDLIKDFGKNAFLISSQWPKIVGSYCHLHETFFIEKCNKMIVSQVLHN